jgi:hypothetical protein
MTAVAIKVADKGLKKAKPVKETAASAAPVLDQPVVKTPVPPVARKTRAKRTPPTKEVMLAPPPPLEAKPTKPVKVKPAKLVRDSFTMPEPEYAAIATLKVRCMSAGVAAKKSEILRAAIAALAKLNDTDLAAAIQGLAAIKTGRPAKTAK